MPYREPEPTRRRPRRHALIVEGRGDVHRELALRLRARGWLVTHVMSGAAALAVLRRVRVDLVLLVALGGRDGGELPAELLAVQPELDVIVVTAAPAA